MTTTQHTPGPWEIETIPTKYSDLHEYNIRAPQGWQDPDGTFCTCSIATGLDSLPDARLIAAAPDMLARLRALELILWEYINHEPVDMSVFAEEHAKISDLCASVSL